VAEKKLPFDQQKTYKSNDHKRRARKLRILKITVLAVVLLLIMGGGATASVVANYINEMPPIDLSRLETVETSYLYDSDGNEITALHDEQNRVAVSLDQIPEHVQQAFIAIEDERFHDHFGFDITASIRAAYVNFRAGRIVQGASTITQQLAQNAFLTTETSYKRKVQEIWLAIQLERIYSKQEILEMYINRVYFGNGAYGIEAAAKTYFDKSVNELELNEAAMLAGAVRSPNRFNPIDNQNEAERRMRVVLSNMNKLEHITDEEYRQALEQELNYSEPEGPEYPYPHYVDYVVHNELLHVLSELPEIGSREEAYRAIYTGGLRVYTNLETSMQSHVENILSNDELYPATYKVDMNRAREALAELPAGRSLTPGQMEELVVEENGVAQPQAAIVLADPTTGQVKALGGGRDYQKNVDEVLRFHTSRQPGSAIKPIITYAPAFEEGILAGPGSTLDDSPYKNEELNWYPENFDYKFRGMITAREALYKSFNIPAVRAFEELGTQKGAEYAERMGISTLLPEERDNLSLTLGGFTRGVRAIDMAQAFSVLANRGLKVDLHTVEKVEDRQGNTLYENSFSPDQIVSPQSAFLVNDILQDYVTEYLGTALQIDRPVAAKTGTTDRFRDAYLVAYTPNLVASFWMGYDEPRMGQVRNGWRYSTAFLREVFLEAFDDLEIVDFEQPDGIVRMQVCNKSGLRPNDDCREAGTVVSDYFLADLAPTETCDLHEDGYYYRPPYIETDERWSRGGPGRGPADAEENGTMVLSRDLDEENGSTTDEIPRFDAYMLSDAVTLRWNYDGPSIAGFELTRTFEKEGEIEESTIELDQNLRQFTDDAIQTDSHYTYTLAAKFIDGTLSDPVQVNISTETSPDGEIVEKPEEDVDEEIAEEEREDNDLVVMPDVVGSFQSIAESAIEREGLKIGYVEHKYDDELSRNRVISQRPSAGSEVPKGREVRLVVSKGSE